MIFKAVISVRSPRKIIIFSILKMFSGSSVPNFRSRACVCTTGFPLYAYPWRHSRKLQSVRPQPGPPVPETILFRANYHLSYFLNLSKQTQPIFGIERIPWSIVRCHGRRPNNHWTCKISVRSLTLFGFPSIGLNSKNGDNWLAIE